MNSEIQFARTLRLSINSVEPFTKAGLKENLHDIIGDAYLPLAVYLTELFLGAVQEDSFHTVVGDIKRAVVDIDKNVFDCFNAQDFKVTDKDALTVSFIVDENNTVQTFVLTTATTSLGNTASAMVMAFTIDGLVFSNKENQTLH